MKKVILMLSAIAMFTSCKKEEPLNNNNVNNNQSYPTKTIRLEIDCDTDCTFSYNTAGDVTRYECGQFYNPDIIEVKIDKGEKIQIFVNNPDGIGVGPWGMYVDIYVDDVYLETGNGTTFNLNYEYSY